MQQLVLIFMLIGIGDSQLILGITGDLIGDTMGNKHRESDEVYEVVPMET